GRQSAAHAGRIRRSARRIRHTTTIRTNGVIHGPASRGTSAAGRPLRPGCGRRREPGELYATLALLAGRGRADTGADGPRGRYLADRPAGLGPARARQRPVLGREAAASASGHGVACGPAALPAAVRLRPGVRRLEGPTRARLRRRPR